MRLARPSLATPVITLLIYEIEYIRFRHTKPETFHMHLGSKNAKAAHLRENYFMFIYVCSLIDVSMFSPIHVLNFQI